jgi:hypothetical protein
MTLQKNNVVIGTVNEEKIDLVNNFHLVKIVHFELCKLLFLWHQTKKTDKTDTLNHIDSCHGFKTGFKTCLKGAEHPESCFFL